MYKPFESGGLHLTSFGGHITKLEFSGGLKITTRPGLQVFKPEPDAVQHTSMNCLPGQVCRAGPSP